jgi:hypothetical protein
MTARLRSALIVVVAILPVLALLVVSTPSGARAATSLPAVPAAWPFSDVQMGFSDEPGGASAIAASGMKMRYQYLAGGVNTGNGWATWNTNPNGSFVTYYVQDSVAANVLPVFDYYMLLQSNPATGGDEAAKDLSNLNNTSTMTAYWADVKLFLQRAKAAASGKPVVLHVEPDLWGYIEQAAANNKGSDVPAKVAAAGGTDLAGLPNNAAGFAQAFIKLRDLYAPNVILAWHLSDWGTMVDLHASQTSDAQTDTLAATASAFYTSLGANFDLSFNDLSDRDSGFYRVQYGDGGKSWWNASDFPRYARFIADFVAATGKRVVVWQIPMGNTLMRATNDTWGHYADNRPEYFLNDVSDGHLALWRDAGVIGLLFGGGATGTTCACDAMGDGTTNPAASGTHTRTSLSADDDGGYLHNRISAYYAGTTLSLAAGDPGSSPSPSSSASPSPSGSVTPTPTPTPTPKPVTWTVRDAVAPTTVHRKHYAVISTTIRASLNKSVLIDVEIYGPNGKLAAQKFWSSLTFKGGVARTIKWSWYVGSTRPLGKYTVKVGIFSTGWGTLYDWRNAAATFRVAS